MSDDGDLPIERSADGLALFDEQAEEKIRRVWHQERWWFSVIDVIGVLTDSSKPRQYWFDMKRTVHTEGFREVSEKIRQLKMRSADGKQRLTDAADAETLLRIIQSVPSPKAEPIKQWLARVGTERLAEMEEPGLAIERARKMYAKQGYSDDWIEKRIQGIAIREELTAEWADRGADDGRKMARLTNILHEGTFDLSIAEHQTHKGLKPRQNLRDSMTTLELLLTSLAEESAKTLHQSRDSQGMTQLTQDTREAGEVAGAARRDLETRSGQPAVSRENYTTLRQGRQRELQPPLLADTNATDESAE